MSLTFNCGIGGVLVVDKSVTETVLQQLLTSGLTASVIGRLCEKQGNGIGGHAHKVMQFL